MRPTLAINMDDYKNYGRTLGLRELLDFLIESNLFEIKEHSDRIKPMRWNRATTLYFNDKKVYLDLWEYGCPTYSGQIFDGNFDLIIKLQHSTKITPEKFEKMCSRKKLFHDKTPEERKDFFNKIIPWTFFGSRLMKKVIRGEQKLEEIPVTQDAFFCGKRWKSRHKILDKINEWGIEYIKSSQELRKGRPLTDKEYLKKMQSSKYGLVLKGRGSLFTEAKNRREIDYMILKKPLLLNYKPYYYNPLIDGKHYIYIDENTDFKNIDKLYNIDEIAQNGYKWYEQNASPIGAAKTFLQIMNEKLS